MKLDKIVIDNIKIFIKEYYSNQYACLISGSYVDGKNNEYSDIDVLIFTKDRNTVFNETLAYNNLKIQAIIVPIQNFQEILWVDYITCKGSFISMISKGFILFDNTNYLKHLIPYTQKLKLLGGRPLTNHEVYMRRVKITTQLFNIMGQNDIDELLFSIASVLDMITEFKLKISGNWCGEGKHRMRQIKSLDKKFHSNLLNAVYKVYGNKNKMPLIRLIKELLNQHGGMLPYYSKANSLSNAIDDYMVIEIENNQKKESTIYTIKTLSDFMVGIGTQNINYYFFSSRPVGKNSVKQNVYMIIETNKEFINDYLIDRLNFFVKNKKGLVKLLFPFQYDPIYSFSTKEIYKEITPLLYKTSELVLKKPIRVFNQSFQLNFSIKLFNHIKTIWFDNNLNVFNLFMDYLLDCWLVFSYDDGVTYRVEGLLKNKNEVLKKFESMYQNQKEELNKIYHTEKGLDKEILNLIKGINEFSKVDDIPIYKACLMNQNLNKNGKLISLYREVIFRLFSVVFIDSRFVSYLPFVVKKIELND